MEIYARPGKPPNMCEAEDEIRAKRPGASRPFIREVLREPQFKNLRLPRGNQRKRLELLGT